MVGVAGDYTSGGGLNFDGGRKMEGKYKWFTMDGQDYCWNDPHKGGTKYRIVLFRSDKKTKSAVMKDARQRKLEKEKAEKEEALP